MLEIVNPMVTMDEKNGKKKERKKGKGGTGKKKKKKRNRWLTSSKNDKLLENFPSNQLSKSRF